MTNTKTILAISIAATIILGSVALTSNTLITAMAQSTDQSPTTSPCPPADQVQHWDKIIFTIQPLVRLGGEKGPTPIGNIPVSYFGSEFDLKVTDQPGVVVDLHQQIVNSLTTQFQLTAPQQATLYKSIRIIDDKYEIVTCGQTGPQGPAGPTGQQGPPGTISAQTCPPGQVVTGIDAAGKLICTATQSAPSPASINLTPNPATESILVHVTGSHFTPNASVRITLGATLLGVATCDSSGAFTFDFHPPVLGNLVITAQDQSNPVNSATAPLDVTGF